MDRTFGTSYVAGLYSGKETREAALSVIADNITLRMHEKVMDWYLGEESALRKSFHRLCEDSLQAHSEAYSDYRMIDLLQLDCEQYDRLSRKYMDLDSTDVQKRMRRNAVRKAVWGLEMKKRPELTESWEKDIQIEFFIQYAEEQICEYLKSCGREKELGPQQRILEKFVQEMQRRDPDIVFSEISKQLRQYKADLQKHFSNGTSVGYPQN